MICPLPRASDLTAFIRLGGGPRVGTSCYKRFSGSRTRGSPLAMLRGEVLTWTFSGGPRSASRPFTARAEHGGPQGHLRARLPSAAGQEASLGQHAIAVLDEVAGAGSTKKPTTTDTTLRSMNPPYESNTSKTRLESTTASSLISPARKRCSWLVRDALLTVCIAHHSSFHAIIPMLPRPTC